MQGISFDASSIVPDISLVRQRLDELIARGALLQPADLYQVRDLVRHLEYRYGTEPFRST